jgi:hypothetical protein
MDHDLAEGREVRGLLTGHGVFARDAEQFMQLAKFWSRVEIPKTVGWERRCWLWTGALTQDRHPHSSGGHGGGYGCLRVEGEWKRAHVYIWEAYFGPVPEGRIVAHRCNVRHCVNVFCHLAPLTLGQNLSQAHRDGRRRSRP